MKFGRFSLLLVLLTALLAFGCNKSIGTDDSDKPITPVEMTVDEAVVMIKNTPLYFAFDRFDLDNDARNELKAKAGLMIKFPQIKAQIAGHCDERGTEEYNFALGERRAKAAYDYLLMLGVQPSQLSTISYGKMYPATEGHDEEAWGKNRRDEFNVTN